MCARLAALLLLAVALPAWPHAGSNAYLFVTAHDQTVETRLDLAVRDLDEILSLDTDGDGQVTWVEVESSRGGIVEYANRHWRVRSDGRDCARRGTPGTREAVEHTDGWYVVVRIVDQCASAGATTLQWTGVFDVDASHRAQVRWQRDDIVSSTVLSPAQRAFTFGEPGSDGIVAMLSRYLREGVVHVLTGLDHLLFLAGLFLPVALERHAKGWRPLASRREALTRAAFVVTAFTVAHALSLCLVALDLFRPPSRVVESLVAFSVAFAGLNNLVTMVTQRRLAWLAGGFGLIHGAAIGTALLELGLPATDRVLALAAFNVGVECAQLLPAGLAVFVTFAFRERALYRSAILVPGSLAVTLAGTVWFVWRAFALPSWGG
jgi:hydrogenase/urease accessory protein HupE